MATTTLSTLMEGLDPERCERVEERVQKEKAKWDVHWQEPFDPWNPKHLHPDYVELIARAAMQVDRSFLDGYCAGQRVEWYRETDNLHPWCHEWVRCVLRGDSDEQVQARRIAWFAERGEERGALLPYAEMAHEDRAAMALRNAVVRAYWDAICDCGC